MCLYQRPSVLGLRVTGLRMLNLSVRRVHSRQPWIIWFHPPPPPPKQRIRSITPNSLFLLNANLLSSYPHFFFLSNNSDNALNICNTLSRFYWSNFSYIQRLTLIAVNKIFSLAKKQWLLGRIEIHWAANLLCSIMRYNAELVIPPLPLHCCLSKSSESIFVNKCDLSPSLRMYLHSCCLCGCR